MRYSTAMVGVVLAVLPIAGCAEDGAPGRPEAGPTTSAPAANPTSTPSSTSTTSDPEADGRLLRVFLPPSAPTCAEGTRNDDTSCGAVLDAAAEKVNRFEKLVKTMSDQARYREVLEAVDQFQAIHQTILDMACYTPKPSSLADDEACEAFRDLLSLSFLNIESKLSATAEP